MTKQHSLYVHKIKGKTRVAEQVEVLRGSSKKNDVWTLSQRFCFVVKENSSRRSKSSSSALAVDVVIWADVRFLLPKIPVLFVSSSY